MNNLNTNKCRQVWLLCILLLRNKLMACTYAHRHTQAVAWSCVISPSGSWRTAGMLIKFDCSLCRIYNSLHFSAFNKLRIQRGSPEPLPQICTHTHKVKGLSSHLRVPRVRTNETSTWIQIVYNVCRYVWACVLKHFKVLLSGMSMII